MSNWQLLLDALVTAERGRTISRLERELPKLFDQLFDNTCINNVMVRFLEDYKSNYFKKTRKELNVAQRYFSESMEHWNDGDFEKYEKVKIQALVHCPVSSVTKLDNNENRFNIPPLPLPDTFLANSDFPHASVKLKVARSEEKGRHVICEQPVKAGEVLFVEPPVASIVNMGFQYKFCHKCCIRLTSVKPCPYCTEIVFCSEDCWLGARTVHEMECGFQALFHSIGSAHLALRALFTAGSFSDLLERLNSFPSVANSNRNLSGYHGILGLQYHVDSLPNEELFQYAVSSLLLVTFLEKYTDYFPKPCQREHKRIVGEVLLKHMLQIVCNAHAVVFNCRTAADGENGVMDVSRERVATGIYPSSAMMNHSCDPNIYSCFSGNVLMVRAVRDIGAGEEVFNSYGAHHIRMTKAMRQTILKEQYNFDCTCLPCSLPFDTAEIYDAYRCPQCSGPLIVQNENGSCWVCGNPFEVTTEFSNAKYMCNVILEKARKYDFVDLQCLIAAWRAARKVLYHSHDLTVRLADEMARRFAQLGQFSRSLRVQKALVLPLKARFGDPSSVLAGEYSRLSSTARAAAIEVAHNGVEARQYLNDSNHYTELAIQQCVLLYGTADLFDNLDIT